MGSGVARQCSRNRCLGQWTVWIPYRGRRGGEGRANAKKDLVTGPIRGFCAHSQNQPFVDIALEIACLRLTCRPQEGQLEFQGGELSSGQACANVPRGFG